MVFLAVKLASALLAPPPALANWLQAWDAPAAASSLYTPDARVGVVDGTLHSDPRRWRAEALVGLAVRPTCELSLARPGEVAAVLHYVGREGDRAVGFHAAVRFELDPSGRIRREVHYLSVGNARLPAAPRWGAPVHLSQQGDARERRSVEALERAQRAVDARDPVGVAALAAPDFAFHHRVGGRRELRGPEGLRQNLAEAFAMSPDFRQRYVSWAVGPWAVHAVRSTGTIPTPAPARRFEFNSIEFFEFGPHGAVQMWMFGNGEALAAQLAPQEAP